MVAEPDQRQPKPAARASGREHAALASFAAGAERLLESATLNDALDAVARVTADAADADLVVVRVLEAAGEWLATRAVAARSPAVAAEIEASAARATELGPREIDDVAVLPESARRAAALVGAAAVIHIPLVVAGRPAGTLEIFRAGRPFEPSARLLARLAVAQIAFAIRAFAGGHRVAATSDGHTSLALAGEALAAGSDQGGTAAQVARLAAEATGATSSVLWLSRDGERPTLSALHGSPLDPVDVRGLESLALRALDSRQASAVDADSAAVPESESQVTTLCLGQPPLGVLQLVFPAGGRLSRSDLRALPRFGARAAHALRASENAQRVATELERTRALLAVVAQAIAQLSLMHTLETAVGRVGELLSVDRVAIYLHDGSVLQPAADRAITGPHARVAESLLELALGPFRGRGMVVIEDARLDRRLMGVREAAAEAGIEAAVGVPLFAREHVIGLLAVYPPHGREISPNEAKLLSALAAQLAVAVENARLHEHAKRLGSELEQALRAERQAARELRCLYEISRSFAQSLSLETTLEAVARTVVEAFDLDAAVIRMPDERREFLVTRAIHVADSRLYDVVRTILSRAQPMAAPPVQRLLETAEPLLLDPERASTLDTSHSLLGPFLEKGSTAGIIPIATSAEVLATLTLLSLDPLRPITAQTVESAVSIGRQAALAIDNARLYQQQKDFADTMQRSLLPRSRPTIDGIELGEVYESSARVDVGGDVYDYVVLADGRLAVVLGDVTGHGIAATADMAMAKFVFRSLTHEHPAPGDFLAFANEVVVGEITAGKFITMAYVTIDPRTGEVACASAGHPPPRLVRADGSVSSFGTGGLPLGVESGQEYPEARDELGADSSIVLYTDGLLEARHDGELYGVERLDGVLASKRRLPAPALARAVVEDCRAFAGGDLSDDCAVVVIKRLP